MTLSLAVFLFSCGGGDQKAADQDETTQEQVAETPAPDFSAGEAIYKEKCIVCHQADGKGLATAFPPLAGSDYLLADPKRAVHQVIHGSHEDMIVNGVTYNQPMVPQVTTHQEAIDVINYVLNSWGNDGGILSLEDVSDIPLLEVAE